ncbi:flagellar biosynthesis anti-sigma factor FlgM [Candidatus Latescibacterota bacterium]
MNINNINNPIEPKRQVDRDQQIQHVHTERPETTKSQEKQPVVGEPQVKDTLDLSHDTRLVEKLAAAVENTEEPPCEDLINRIRERIETGQYDTAEAKEQIAASLLNFNIQTD